MGSVLRCVGAPTARKQWAHGTAKAWEALRLSQPCDTSWTQSSAVVTAAGVTQTLTPMDASVPAEPDSHHAKTCVPDFSPTLPLTRSSPWGLQPQAKDC